MATIRVSPSPAFEPFDCLVEMPNSFIEISVTSCASADSLSRIAICRVELQVFGNRERLVVEVDGLTEYSPIATWVLPKFPRKLLSFALSPFERVISMACLCNSTERGYFPRLLIRTCHVPGQNTHPFLVACCTCQFNLPLHSMQWKPQSHLESHGSSPATPLRRACLVHPPTVQSHPRLVGCVQCDQ